MGTSLLTPQGSTREWRKLRALILSRDGHRCGYCGGPANTVDHIIARCLGGSDARSNLVAACKTCNRAKGARGPGGGGVASRRAPGHQRAVLSPSVVKTSRSPLPPPAREKARCYRCEQMVPVNHFASDRTKASGRKSICLPCDREKSVEYYAIAREVNRLPDDRLVTSRDW